MAKKFNWKSKNLWKKVGIGAVAGVLGLGAIMGIGALVDKAEETTTKNINPTYAVGSLTEDGKYLESKGAIYTKDSFQCDGLDIDLAFNNNISYRIFFYDEDNNFIESTDNQNSSYNTKDNIMPIGTEYARIVITPNDDDNIKWYEVDGYAKQLEIEVAKDQDSGINVKQLVNLFEIDEEHIGYFRTLDGGNGKYNVASNMGVSTPIKVTGIKTIKFVYNTPSENSQYTFEKNDGTGISSAQTGTGLMELVIEVPDGAEVMYVGYALGNEFSVYAID